MEHPVYAYLSLSFLLLYSITSGSEFPFPCTLGLLHRDALYRVGNSLHSLSLSSTVYTSCSVHIRACVCRVIRDCVQSLRCSKESESERDCWERGWFKWVNTSPRRSCQNLLGHWNDDDDPVLLSSGFILVWCVKNWSVLRRGCIDERVSRFRYSEASVQRDT